MPGYNSNVDLIQNMREMTALAAKLSEEFAAVEPSMETIFALRDDFENLEARTIEIVNNYETNIQNSQAEAQKIIDDLNVEVERIRSNIDELLNLSDNFESIADEIATLVQMKSTVDDLVTRMEELEKKGSFVVIHEGEDDIPVEERTAGNYYLRVTDQMVSGVIEGTVIRVSPAITMKVE